MKGLGEFELIDSIKEAMSDIREDAGIVGDEAEAGAAGVLGIGDDCAIIPQRDGIDTLVSTDMLIESVHFILDDVTPEQLGWKTAAVNISDIAAMGGVPKSTFLSIALPPAIDELWMKRFIKGYREISLRYGVALLGGDTTSSKDTLCISVTVLGESSSGTAVRRGGALTEDLICVTGNLGDSAGGLRLVLERMSRGAAVPDSFDYGTPASPAEKLIERHYRPVPRVAEGIALREAGVHSMMDISDGIGSDLRHILEESGKAAVVDLASVPLSQELVAVFPDALDLACSGGEDYELLFTVAPGIESVLDVPHTVIGRITDGPVGTILWQGAAATKDYKGFHHF